MQTVLIVDDITDNLYYLEVLLKGNGFDVHSAQNGAEALQSARRNPPDLVVSDILMPVMDGYALCREWRSDQRLKDIPFIFYTATFIEKKDEELAMGLGADRFVIKPQEPEELMKIIRDVLANSCRGVATTVPDDSRDEGALLREYNEALFRKLEKKMIELEKTNCELEQTIAEQKRLEEQLRQVQKMEAIGRFSAGIAHDFNNILTVIIGFGTMLQLQMDTDSPQREKVGHILASAERAANLTRSLLTFSRKQEMKLQPLNLNNCIRNVETFLRRIIGEDVKLLMSLQENITIIADSGHIEQVLMNLATNARDAMPNGGVLSIGTDIAEIDDAFITMHGYGTPGRYAVIAVADSGIGMDETTRQRIFEPFFTTKEIGQGTGLGLSIIYGIIRQHDGYINVYSEPGQGTTFRIYLPLVLGDCAARDAEKSPHAMSGGSETILVVDDEASIRQYLKLFLSSLGYKVLFACDGQEAAEIFREHVKDINLVLMDIIMPNGNGRDAAREIRNIRSNVKIIYTSGYPADLIRERKLLEDGALLLMKPLTPTRLAVQVRAALDGLEIQ